MPAQILHVLFGEDSILRAVDSLRAAAASDAGAKAGADAEAGAGGGLASLQAADLLSSVLVEGEGAALFRLGCQGPDLFYHNQRTRPLSISYGTLLHRRGYGTFCAALLARTLAQRGRAEAAATEAATLGAAVTKITPEAAYALGFSTHAFLDRSLHPYIVCKAGWVSPTRPETERFARCHAFFERIIDSLMLGRLRGTAVAAWDQDSLLAAPCADPGDLLKPMIAAALADTYERAKIDEKLAKRMENAFKDSAGFYRVTNPARTSFGTRINDGYEYLSSDRGRSAVALMYPEGFTPGLDYLNLARASWRHPCETGGADVRSVPELYEEALVESTAFLTATASALAISGKIPAETAAMIGDEGLSILDGAGVPCAPVHAEPLPLDEVLDAQYALRLQWIASRGNVGAGRDFN